MKKYFRLITISVVLLALRNTSFSQTQSVQDTKGSFVTKPKAPVTVCELLQKQTIQPSQVSAKQWQDYQDKLKAECLIQQDTDALKLRAQALGITLEQVTLYQAMRFVNRTWYEPAKANDIPVSLIYQKDCSYDLPLNQRTALVWENWSMAAANLPRLRDQLLLGQPLTLPWLNALHMSFYPPGRDETGPCSNPPSPGVFKPRTSPEKPWWSFKTEAEAMDALAVVRDINQKYDSLDLLPRLKGALTTINLVLDVRKLADGTWAIFSGPPLTNPLHIQNELSFINTLMTLGQKAKPMLWNDQLFTPGEFAFLIQQHFVGVHPYADGNGRTSRMLQELILTSFGLPFFSSGDLMDIDVLTRHADYYQTAIAKTKDQLTTLKDCFDQDQVKVDSPQYDCRILK